MSSYEGVKRSELIDVTADMRCDVLTICHTCGEQKGHLGGAMSAIEILAVLYTQVMNIGEVLHSKLFWGARDRFIMSKGHASMAMYAAMKHVGLISQQMIDGPVRGEASVLHRHPKRNIAYGIEASVGSLGMGIGYGIGLAEVFRRQGSTQRVYVMLGDGECDEGSVWEGAAYASHRCLDNLIVIVDKNGLQLDGPTDEILSMNNMRERWEAFGFYTVECDGHDMDALCDAFETPHPGRPLAIIADTVKGRGISFAEGRVEWHDHVLSDDLYKQGIQDIGTYDRDAVRLRAAHNYATRRIDVFEPDKGAGISCQVDPGAPLLHKLVNLAVKDAVGAALTYIADYDRALALLYADCGERIGIGCLKERHPEMCYEVGISEQNMVAMATSMAQEGLHVFAVSYAPFIIGRALDQVKVGLGYMGAPVTLIGLSAGFAMSDLGVTHMALEDIAWMRALPNVSVLAPADAVELTFDLAQQVRAPKPCYVRVTAASGDPLHDVSWPGVANGLMELLAVGGDVALVGCGSILPDVLAAARLLDQRGISCSVYGVGTIKPLDTATLDRMLHSRLIVTIEEHDIIGGLGSAVAEYLAALPQHPALLRLGVPDVYYAADLPDAERRRCGLSSQGIAEAVVAVLTAQT